MRVLKSAIKITRDEFFTYEVIRQSGLTNMFDTRGVMEYSIIMGGPVLTKELIVEIMANYPIYLRKYPLPTDAIIKIRKVTSNERHQG